MMDTKKYFVFQNCMSLCYFCLVFFITVEKEDRLVDTSLDYAILVILLLVFLAVTNQQINKYIRN